MKHSKLLLSTLTAFALLSGCNSSTEQTEPTQKTEITESSLQKGEEVYKSENSLLDSMSSNARSMSEGEFIENSITEIVPELVNSYVPDYYVDEVLALDELQLENLNRDVELLTLLHGFYSISNNSERSSGFASLSDIVVAISDKIYTYIYAYFFGDELPDDSSLYGDIVDIVFGDENSSVSSADVTSSSVSSLSSSSDEALSSVSSSSQSSVVSSISSSSSSIDNEIKSFVGGSKLPTTQERETLFTKESVSSLGYIYYIASSAPEKLDWQMNLGESGYMQVYMPPGVTELHMGLNSESLAASQSIYFKDMGEVQCSSSIPDAPNYEVDASNWKVFTGSHSYTHPRESAKVGSENCVLYAFYNRDNQHTNAYLQDVSFTYEVGNRNLYDSWLGDDGMADSLSVTLQADSFSGVAPFKVNLSADISGGDGSYTYNWNFGDSDANATAAQLSHTYQNRGEYIVKLEVSDGSGNSKTLMQTINVRASGYEPTVNNFQIESTTFMPLLNTEYYDKPNEGVEFWRLSKEHRSINSGERILTGNGYVYSGESYDIRILVAPGVDVLSMHGTSNNWNVTAGYAQPQFAYYTSKSATPYPYCQNAEEENCFDSTKLRTSQGQFPLPALYRKDTPYSIDEAFYVHFIVEVPSNGTQFSFATLTIQQMITNIDTISIYRNWQSAYTWNEEPVDDSINDTASSQSSSSSSSSSNNSQSDDIATLSIDSLTVNKNKLLADFTASINNSGDQNANIVYEWDFGDGSGVHYAYRDNKSYTYNSAGTYDVSLSIFVYGTSNKVKKTLRITVSE